MKGIVTALGVVSLIFCAEARGAEPTDERIEWIRENAIEITTPEAGNGLEELADHQGGWGKSRTANGGLSRRRIP